MDLYFFIRCNIFGDLLSCAFFKKKSYINNAFEMSEDYPVVS